MIEETLRLFFSKKFENEINEKMMYRTYKLDNISVLNYINDIINIDYDYYINYIIENYDVQYLLYKPLLTSNPY